MHNYFGLVTFNGGILNNLAWKMITQDTQLKLQTCRLDWKSGSLNNWAPTLTVYMWLLQGQRGTVGSVAQWVACVIHKWSVISLNPIKGFRCFLEEATLPSLLSTGWFQEQIWVWFHNLAKINRGSYGR